MSFSARSVLFASLALASVMIAGPTRAQQIPPLLASGGTEYASGKVQVVVLPSFQGPGFAPTTSEFNLWITMTRAWNINRARQAVIMRQEIASKLGFYNVSVTIAEALVIPAPGAATIMAVDPRTKTLRLTYRVPGNRMSGKLDAAWRPDPSVSGKFDLEVVMDFVTTGQAGEPLVLRSTQVRALNMKPLKALDLEVQGPFFSMPRKVFGDAGTGGRVTAEVNRVFRLMSGTQGIGSVTPGMRVINAVTRLVFHITPPRLAPSPGAGVVLR